jgi:hypothetical protein
MFTMIKLGLALVFLALFAYLTFFVDFGEKTLYEHLGGISETPEAQQLKDEIAIKVDQTKAEVSQEVVRAAGILEENAITPLPESPGAAITEEERQALEELIHSAGEPGEDDRAALNRLIEEKSR